MKMKTLNMRALQWRTDKKFDFNEETQILYLYVKNLKKDESRTFLIDFENVNEYNANERIIFRTNDK